MLDQIAKYRQVVTLCDGKRVLLRPLTRDDKDALLGLFDPISSDDLKLMRNDVRNREVAPINDNLFACHAPIINRGRGAGFLTIRRGRRPCLPIVEEGRQARRPAATNGRNRMNNAAPLPSPIQLW